MKNTTPEPSRRGFLRKSLGVAGGVGLALSLPVLNGCEETIIKAGPPDLIVIGDEAIVNTAGGTYSALSLPGTLISIDILYQGEKLKIMMFRVSETEATTMTRVCTHNGCDLGITGNSSGTLIDSDTVECGCHTSRFNLATGAVERGPATENLPTYVTTIDGDLITIKLA